MFITRLLAASAAITSTAASAYTIPPTSQSNRNCTSLKVPVTVTPTVFDFGLPALDSNIAVTQFAFEAFLIRDPKPASPSSNHSFTATYEIDADFCTPTQPTEKSSTVQVLTHGIGFDKTYWDFPLHRSNYSYVDYAIAEGYSTFSYSRLATGSSSKANPLTEIQSPTELAILRSLTTKIRSNSLPHALPFTPKKIIHVGHSYGSILSTALAAKYPTLSDGLILTGFSHNWTWQGTALVTWGMQLASQNGVKRLKEWKGEFVTWTNEWSNQQFFLTAPGDTFAVDVLEYSEKNKMPQSIATFLSLGALDIAAPEFGGPVQIITGQYDLPFCGGDCTDVLASSEPKFKTAVEKGMFEAVVHPASGHGINLQYNATGAYQAIFGFLEKHGL